MLQKNSGGHAPAVSLADLNVKYQIRSIAPANKAGTIYKAVFGKVRFDGKPEQADPKGGDADVELMPGYGLVEKNHFLYFKDIGLLVFQRNGNAGRYSHLQSYLNLPNYAGIVLAPIVTEDSYNRLMDGGPMKKLEVSLRRPSQALAAEDEFIADCIDLFQHSGGASLKLVISAERGGTISSNLKSALVKVAKFGRAKVARATMFESGDPIDLIADRIVYKTQVDLLTNGRLNPLSVFSGLASAKDACADQLKIYFGSKKA